jgi:hypothetical protein
MRKTMAEIDKMKIQQIKLNKLKLGNANRIKRNK